MRTALLRYGKSKRVDDEPGAVLDLDGVLAARSGERDGRGDRLVGGGDRADDLDELHHRRRVEEVDAAHQLGPLGGHGQFDDRQRRGVGGEDRVGLDDRVEFGEQRLLDGEVLDDALDHEVGERELGQIVGDGDAAEDREALLVGQLLRG